MMRDYAGNHPDEGWRWWENLSMLTWPSTRSALLLLPCTPLDGEDTGKFNKYRYSCIIVNLFFFYKSLQLGSLLWLLLFMNNYSNDNNNNNNPALESTLVAPMTATLLSTTPSRSKSPPWSMIMMIMMVIKMILMRVMINITIIALNHAVQVNIFLVSMQKDSHQDDQYGAH